LGSKKVHSVKISKAGDDKRLLKELRSALLDADILIGHNLARFDILKINGRLIRHGIDPLPPIPVVDTLRELKRVAKFPSHRLDYLAKELLGGGKQETSQGLWLRAMKGDKKAINEMVRYCKVDVIKTEELYLKLRPYFLTHPHVGVLLGNERGHCCNKCGGVHLKKNGLRPTATGLLRQELQCMDCGSYQRIPFAIKKRTRA
jgi:uncharacterized protein YprB with RNaseH-like and TPR domain